MKGRVLPGAGAAVTGRMSTRPRTIDEALAQAELPESLARLVRETVRRTRLRRGERMDIAQELISHLREGLDAEVDPKLLAAHFGDPRTVAPLLRSAVRRRRSRFDRFVVGTCKWGGGAIAALGALYLLAVVRIAFLEPRISFDPFARINAMTPQAPAGERAWPLYREALSWHHEERTRPGGRNIGASLAGRPEDPAEIQADMEHLRGREAEIAQLRRAAALPALGWTFAERLSPEDRARFGPEIELHEGTLFTAPMPYLAELRWAARLLALDARAALAEGESRRAVENLVAMLGVARHVNEHPVLVSQLIESSVIELAARETVHIIEDAPDLLSDEDLKRLRRAFAAIDPASWRLDLTIERMAVEDLIQRVYSDDGRGDGVLLLNVATQLGTAIGVTAEGREGAVSAFSLAAGPLAATVMAGRRETLATADRFYGLIEREASLPIAQRPHAMDVEIERLMSDSWRRIRQPVIALFMPAGGRVSDVRAAVRTDVDGAITAIALEEWRRRHGAWPASLEELVPDLLSRVPDDAYDGKPLRYRLDEEGPLLWSVGPNALDEGGTPALTESGDRLRRPERRDRPGDLVLFRGGGG